MTRTGIYEGQLGMDDALRRTGPAWAELARHAVADLCSTGATFTAEDVRRLAGDPEAPNAMGALLHAIADEGWISMVGTVKSTRPNAHGRRVIVWRASA
jgi:hypothetical protein